MRPARAVTVMTLAIGIWTNPVQPQPLPQFDETPITPGFWSFPSKKLHTIHDIAETCSDRFEIRFADGHFIGLRTNKTELAVVRRYLEKVGRCTFNSAAQIEYCEVSVTNPDGSIIVGTTENKMTSDADKTLRQRVIAKMITDTPFADAPFEVFPLHCPEDAMWNILSGTSQKNKK